MDTTRDTTERREDLGFRKAVTTAFEYLVREFGFRVACSSQSSVVFLSERVKVVVEIEPFSYQIDVWIGPLLKDGYSLEEIIGSHRADRARPRGWAQASTPSSVRNSVHKLATLFREYAVPAIEGDPSVYQEYASYRRRQEYDRTDQAMNSATRSAAERAWQGKEFEHVIELYESVKGNLKTTEERRLNYARRKLGKLNSNSDDVHDK